jgi:adenylate cyclase
MISRILRFLLLPLGALLFTGYFTFLSSGLSLRPLELKARDAACRLLLQSGGKVFDDRIVIVGIEDLMRKDPRFGAESLHWRGFHGQLIDKITRAGAAVIAFDLFFERQNAMLDDFLVDSLARSGRVILGRRSSSTSSVFSPPVPLARAFRRFPSATCTVPLDEDGVIRRAFAVNPRGPAVCRLSLAAACAAAYEARAGASELSGPSGSSRSSGGAESSASSRISVTEAPLDGDGFFPIRFAWYPPAFAYADYRRVLDARDEEMRGFSGRIVLVGDTSGADVVSTPLGTMNGVELHGHIVSQLLRRDFVRFPSDAQTALIMIIMAAIAAYADTRTRRGQALTIVAAVALAWSLFSYFLFVTFQFFPGLFSPLSTLTATSAVLLLRRHKATRQALGRFVPPSFLDRLIEKEAETALHEREVTITFSDLRGFTTLSEKTDATSMMEQLNEYNQTMQRIIAQYHGYVSSLQGDAIMAVFGVLREGGHAQLALEAAKAMVLALEDINAARAGRGLEPLSFGVGINTGVCAVGFLGASQHMEFAAIGDTTNTAARLQSLCRELDCRIIISESTYEKLEGPVDARRLPPAMLKGKTKPVSIYKVM